ncbi:hypothetical protein EZ449_20710 [Pedobacter frigidisoli]|uniref:Tyr recombinase domain-containing protein n=1 Tax=Pedobacter frigidisoli TaxID=2530455 RepID=A0A4R0NIS8_9SPHI|nr:site-specific integrase [Pedobacter frigidisoli]TCD00580.1 hypothetical protein EZ449_20710 [Pedobacter frigidisoli]
MKNTLPRIVTSKDLNSRSYVTFYYLGKRIREYNGDSINIDLKPNTANSIKERNQLLKKLEYEYTKALENKHYQINVKEPLSITVIEPSFITAKGYLDQAIAKKLKSNINNKYKTNLETIHTQFLKFLNEREKSGRIENISLARVEDFLSNYSSSGTYYMNKRRDLGVLFSTINKQLKNKIHIIQDSEKMKSSAKLHKVYQEEQIKPILDFLKENHHNLYICCLITYATFLRPHHEIRALKLSHIKNDCTEIHLDGAENKGKRIRIVYIPDYLRKELLPLIDGLTLNDSLFTKTIEIPNEYYFSTAWTRQFKAMQRIGLIEKNQTIYSFRHTAAVQVYNKTKDLHILQQLLGHSDMIVTLKYLRGLAAIKNENLKDVMPTLNL